MISRSSGQSQGHRNKKRVNVSCSRVVCVRLKVNLVYIYFYKILNLSLFIYYISLAIGPFVWLLGRNNDTFQYYLVILVTCCNPHRSSGACSCGRPRVLQYRPRVRNRKIFLQCQDKLLTLVILKAKFKNTTVCQLTRRARVK